MSQGKAKHAFVFDLGGVVINRGMWIWHEKIAEIFHLPSERVFGVFIKKRYRDFFSGKLSWIEYITQSLSELGIKIGPAQAGELHQLLISCYKPQLNVFKLLVSLRNRGETLILLSDQHHSMLEDLDRKYKILERFDHVIISSEMGLTKQDPRLFKLAEAQIRELGEFDKIIFIDDLEENLSVPCKLGWDTILFRNGKQLRRDIKVYL